MNSYAWIRALGACKGLKATDILVGCVLHTWRGADATCYPTLRQLADRAHVGTRTVSRGLAALEREGFVVVVAHGHQNRATRYRLIENADNRRKSDSDPMTRGLHVVVNESQDCSQDGSSSNLNKEAEASASAKETDLDQERYEQLRAWGLPVNAETWRDWQEAISQGKAKTGMKAGAIAEMLKAEKAASSVHARAIIARLIATRAG